MIDPEEYSRLSARERSRTLLADFEGRSLSSVGFYLSEFEHETDQLVRWHLAKGLGIHRDTAAIDCLLSIIGEPDIDFGKTSLHLIAAWGLGQIGARALPRVLAATRRSSRPSEQAGLADALGEIGDPSCIEALRALFSHGDSQVRMWAALSLAKIGQAARPELCEMLIEYQTTQEAAIILDAIKKIDQNYFAGRMQALA